MAERAGSGTRRAVLAGLLAIPALSLMAACQPLYQNHGYVPTEEDLAKITVGKDTRDTVAATLGPPSVEGLLNDVGWFYVQSRWKTQGIAAPQEIDRQVVAITFSEKGIVTNVERWGLERGQIVPISRRVTTEPVKGESFLKQLFGNLGAFNAADYLQP